MDAYILIKDFCTLKKGTKVVYDDTLELFLTEEDSIPAAFHKNDVENNKELFMKEAILELVEPNDSNFKITVELSEHGSKVEGLHCLLINDHSYSSNEICHVLSTEQVNKLIGFLKERVNS